MTSLRDAVNRAATGASQTITTRLRDYAFEQGWSPNILSNMQVVYDANEGLGVEFSDEVREAALNLEYGTEKIRPTAAIRKYQNSGHAEQAIVKQLKRELGGLI